MNSKRSIAFVLAFLLAAAPYALFAQNRLMLTDALDIALHHYKSIAAKQHIAMASAEQVEAVKSEYLPDLNIGAQTAYGTINNINSPNYSLPGINTTSGGIVAGTQNWNAASGSLAAVTANWQFFDFGGHPAKVSAAVGQHLSDEAAVNQEIFQLSIAVCSAYLDLLSAQRLTLSMQANLDRSVTLKNLIVTRTASGLNPGVDSVIANAAVSKAQLDLLASKNNEAIKRSYLITYMGQRLNTDYLDTSFVHSTPVVAVDTQGIDNHPSVLYKKSIVELNQREAQYISSLRWPKFSLFTLFQERGSGFGPNYVAGDSYQPNDFFYGLQPMRYNYLLGLSVTWNLTDLIRLNKRSKAQHYLALAANDDYELQKSTLNEQNRLASEKINIAVKEYQESPKQLEAANQAYQQKSSLYHDGLATIADVTQTLYAVNQAQTDQDLAYNAVWQALLFKAASCGDLSLFFNQIKSR